jgi:exonuclease III
MRAGNARGAPWARVPDELRAFESRAQTGAARLDSRGAVGADPSAMQPPELHGVLTYRAFPHGEWVRIHLFANGNGRTARLAREPVRRVAGPDLPWPERHLAVRTCGLEVHTLHAPLSSKEGRAKVHTLEALYAALADSTADGPTRVLAGDLNTPRYESRDGEIVTFARDREGRLRPELGERHDRAELLLIRELTRGGWRDAFRALHGYGRRDRSWAWRTGVGYRLDHIVVSPGLEPVECEYVHEWREEGLSDHSGLWARLAARG